jgi:hypothetical protein
MAPFCAAAGELTRVCEVPSIQATGRKTTPTGRKEVLDDPRTRA